MEDSRKDDPSQKYSPAQVDALSPLDEDGEAGLVGSEEAGGGRGATVEGQAGDGGAIFTQQWRAGRDSAGELFAHFYGRWVRDFAFPRWR